MPLETVAVIADLNAAWPLGGDTVQFGDDHIRATKAAVRSLLSNLAQLGLTTIEATLIAPSTNITYAGVVQRGCQVIVILTQDGAGNRAVIWDAAIFSNGPVDLNQDPNGVTVIAFVGHSSGKLYCYSVRMT